MNDNSAPMTYSCNDVIARYIELRDKCEAIIAAANAAVKPYDDAMKTISNWLAAEMEKMGSTSIKTDSGTAYRSTVTSAKITDHDSFWEFLANGHAQMANLRVSIGDLKIYMEEHHGHLPPGVAISQIHRVNVKRT